MPASSSTAIPMGRRRMAGQNSTRNTAVQKASGRARASATAEVIRVPTIGPAPPYTSVTGFHTVDVKKANPNLEIDGQPPHASMMQSPMVAPNSARDAALHAYWKARSTRCPRTRTCSKGWSGLEIEASDMRDFVGYYRCRLRDLCHGFMTV